jgi:hypothetical protein
MSTPILPYAVWASGTNQNSIPANDNARRSQILNGNVISQAVTAQPGSPAEGDIYIIAATHTGTQWATFTPLDLAIYSGGTWYAFAPVTGVVVNVAGTLYRYTGSAWTAVTAGGGGATIPQNSQSAAYTLVLGDAGKHIFHPSADTTARIWTIPANGTVAFNIGDAVTFVNQNAAGVITIAITTDTLRLAGSGTTGSRTLAANGIATALKVTSTEWIISGTGLT